MKIKESIELLQWFQDNEKEITEKKLNSTKTASMATTQLGYTISVTSLCNLIGSGKGCTYKYEWPASRRGLVGMRTSIYVTQIKIILNHLNIEPTPEFLKIFGELKK